MRVPRMLARSAGRVVDGLFSRLALDGATKAGAGVRVFGWPQVSCEGELVIGQGVVFISRPAPVELLIAPGATLTIGEGSLIESGATLRARRRVVIGSHARIGVGCVLDDDGPNPEEISIGDRAWLEDGVVLLRGARVSPGAVVSQGTVIVGGADELSARVRENETAAHAVEERVRVVIARIVPSASGVERDADLRLFKGWDSLAALRVVVALEKEFGVSLPYDLFSQQARVEAVVPWIAAAEAGSRGTP